MDEAAWDFAEPETAGYSLAEARRNYETRGVMFRPGDPDARSSVGAAKLRSSLTRLLDKRMADPSRWTEEDGNALEEVKGQILAEVAKT